MPARCSRTSGALLLLSALAVGQPTLLQLNKPVERELGPGQTHEYTAQVKAGQFFHVVAKKEGVGLVLTLAGPTGNELFSSDSTGVFGFEHASSLAKEPGVYRLQVAAKAGSLLHGKYTLALRALRRPGKDDLLRIQAEELLRTATS